MEELSQSVRSAIERATVEFEPTGCRGVIVPGGYVLSVGHGFRFTSDGTFTLSDNHVERMRLFGETFLVAMAALEIRADIAAFDDRLPEEFLDERSALRNAIYDVRPIPIDLSIWQFDQSRSVFMLTRTGAWLSGTAIACSEDPHLLWVEFDGLVEDGDSGSPIVDVQGNLLALVSHSSEPSLTNPTTSNGRQPRPCLTLPVWVRRDIEIAQRDERHGRRFPRLHLLIDRVRARLRCSARSRRRFGSRQGRTE